MDILQNQEHGIEIQTQAISSMKMAIEYRGKFFTEIRNKGTQVLIENLGLVDAERFIMLIKKELMFRTSFQLSDK